MALDGFENFDLIKKIVFDPEYYLEANSDVRYSEQDPWDHFIQHGYYEGRDPSPWVRIDYAKDTISKRGGEANDLSSFLALSESATSDSLRWISPFICPAWVMRQLQSGAGSFIEALKENIPDAGISTHPALRAVIKTDEINTVLDLVKRVHLQDIASLSLVDLKEYCLQHRDLNHLVGSPVDAFAHLWTWGYQENRLKYCGARKPKNADERTLFVLNLALVTRQSLAVDSSYSASRLTALPKHSIEAVEESEVAIPRLLDFNAADPSKWLTADDVLHARSRMERRKTYINRANLRGSRTSDIDDRDLFSQRYKVTTPRVVCSINMGGYDNLPTPPKLSDTTYFLITDALSVPDDSPWIIVRPSVREVDMKRTCLWYKTHPHKLFPDAEYVTWIDSNIISQIGSEQVLEAHEALSEVATFAHPDRSCVYKEAEEICNLGLDHPDIIGRVVENMKASGMPSNHGLYETNVLFTRCQDMGVQAFLDKWWQLISTGSRRDQMSFTFAAFLCDIEISNLDGKRSSKTSRFFSKKPHVRSQGRFI